MIKKLKIGAIFFLFSTTSYAGAFICRTPETPTFESSILSLEINGDSVLLRDLSHQDVPFHVLEKSEDNPKGSRWIQFDLHATPAAYVYSLFASVSLPSNVFLGVDVPERFKIKFTMTAPGDYEERNMNCELSTRRNAE